MDASQAALLVEGFVWGGAFALGCVLLAWGVAGLFRRR